MTQYPDFEVLNGATKMLPPTRHVFNNLIIREGGLLKINENSQDWCVIFVENNLIIEGTIEFTKFSSSRNIFSFNFGGIQKDHQFRMLNIGGNGGNGAGTGAGVGGNGVLGNVDFGGGGGSGGMNVASGLKPGISANGFIGGKDGNRFGGDGGQRGQYSNGGLLFLHTKSLILGINNKIIACGQNGGTGTNGSQGTHAGAFHQNPGGGGGGAPGGEGGVVYIEFKTTNNLYFNVDINGGLGGNNGVAGTGGIHPAINGTKGTDGATGKFNYTSID